MNRNRGRRDRGGSRNYGDIGDGLLGEGPGPMYPEPRVNPGLRDSQLALAQTLLQQQALGGFNPDLSNMGDLGTIGALAGAMGNMQFLQHQQAMAMGGGGGGGMRKRLGDHMQRDPEFKRRRRDSSGRWERDRSRGNRDDRDRGRSSRWDKAKDREDYEGEGDEDYDPAEPTPDEESSKDLDNSNLYCHVCNVSVYDDESFRRHLNGTKHAQRMSNVLTVHQMKSTQLQSRLKAQEHLRNIERKGGRDPNFFCKICNNDLTIPWEKHKYSNVHKQRLLQVRRGCGWCGVHDFTNFTEVLEHRETEEHKKNADIYGKKEDDHDRSRSRSGSRSRERKSERDMSKKSSMSSDKAKKDKDKKPKVKKEEEEEEDLTIPEYDAEKAVGLNYIIPVTGFFCKLCHKFYNSEKSAKGAHCQSQTHYDKFKLVMEAKIVEREKRKAEEAEAEAAAALEEEEEEKKRLDEENAEEEMEEDKAEEKENGTEEQEEVGDEERVKAGEEDDEEMIDQDETAPVDKEEDEEVDKEEEINESVQETSLNDTNANSSFTYVAGDMLSLHMELQRQEQLQKEPGDASSQDSAADLTLEDKAADSDGVKAESDEGTASTPVPTSTPPARGRGGTARRGRGRGRAKK